MSRVYLHITPPTTNNTITSGNNVTICISSMLLQLIIIVSCGTIQPGNKMLTRTLFSREVPASIYTLYDDLKL